MMVTSHTMRLSSRTGLCGVGAHLMSPLRAVVAAAMLAPACVSGQGVSQSAIPSAPRLAVGDRVIVKVWPEIKLSDTVIVDERGEINLRHVGSIGVLSFDYDHLRDTLRARYATFLRSPVIDVIAFRRVTVNGAVGKPDIYMIDQTSTIRDVIARAGGIAPNGDAHKVEILRGTERIPAQNWDRADAVVEQLRSGDVILVGRRPWWVENLGVMTGVAGVVASIAFTLLRK
jgi:protein involved in polysaccharide export with SLBB domain